MYLREIPIFFLWLKYRLNQQQKVLAHQYCIMLVAMTFFQVEIGADGLWYMQDQAPVDIYV